MPCYLFTWHAYGSWMPDHRRGYVHRTKGLRPRDPKMAKRYRAKQRDATVWFDEARQRLLVETARGAGGHLDATVHAAAMEPTHAHVLVSWRHDRNWQSMRRSIRHALSAAMNERFGKRVWLSAKGSRRRVRDRAHFDHLVTTYLPRHGGVVWVGDS